MQAPGALGAQVQRLLQPGLAADERFNTNARRAADRAALKALIDQGLVKPVEQ